MKTGELTETVPLELRCETCAGEGGNEVVSCRYGCEQRGGGCTHGRFVWEECPDCDGDGRVRCEACDDSPASEVNANGEKVCRECIERGDAEPVDGDDEAPAFAEWLREEGTR